MTSQKNTQKTSSGKKPTDPNQGVYQVDSDKLSYGFVAGNYSDQGCMTITFDDGSVHPWHQHYNHKGGSFKIHPQLMIEFLQKIGVTLHFETDRKHSYCKKIELKPWSEFEQAMRGSVDNNEE